jgi:hypothetical protein
MPKWKSRVPFRNADGRLYRHLDIKLIIGNDVKKKRHTAAPGKGYSTQDIRDARDALIEELERKFPGVEFREVQILPNAFNYIACEPAPKPPVVIKRPDLQLTGEIFTTAKRPILNEEVKDDNPKETTSASPGEDLATATGESKLGTSGYTESSPRGDGEGEQPQRPDLRTTAPSGSPESTAGDGRRDAGRKQEVGAELANCGESLGAKETIVDGTSAKTGVPDRRP